MRCLPVVLVASVALLLPVSVVAAPPDGFRGSWPITKRASVLVGKPVSAYCARTERAWQVWFETNRSDLSSYPIGYARPKQDEILLPPMICQPLEKHLSRRKPILENLALALAVVGHEAAHLRGVESEIGADRYVCRHATRIARTFSVPRTILRRVVRVMLAETPRC